MLKLLSIVGLAFCVCVTAQQQPSDKPQSIVARPSPELARLTQTFVGSWTTTSKIEPNGFMPAGTAVGSAEFYTGPGDLALGQQYRATGPRGEFVATMLMWWDEKDKGFKQLWCDNLSGCRTSSGLMRWEGSTLKGTEQTEISGKICEVRTSVKDIQPNSFVYEEEIGPVGGELQHVMTVRYSRRVPVPHYPGHRAGRR